MQAPSFFELFHKLHLSGSISSLTFFAHHLSTFASWASDYAGALRSPMLEPLGALSWVRRATCLCWESHGQVAAKRTIKGNHLSEFSDTSQLVFFSDRLQLHCRLDCKWSHASEAKAAWGRSGITWKHSTESTNLSVSLTQRKYSRIPFTQWHQIPISCWVYRNSLAQKTFATFRTSPTSDASSFSSAAKVKRPGKSQCCL